MEAIVLTLLFYGCKNPESKNKSVDSPSTPPGWTALFDGSSPGKWEVTPFGTQGPVQVSGGSMILGMGDGCTGVTWTGDFPRMNYEVSLEAKRVSGNDFFCGMTFPVGESFCSLIVGGWGGPVVGLSTIDGRDGSENETRTLRNFETGKWYRIRLKVSPTKIEAWINGEKTIDFTTGNRKLSIRPEVNLSRPFGICSWKTTAALRDIRLHEDPLPDTDGKVKPEPDKQQNNPHDE